MENAIFYESSWYAATTPSERAFMLGEVAESKDVSARGQFSRGPDGHPAPRVTSIPLTKDGPTNLTSHFIEGVAKRAAEPPRWVMEIAEAFGRGNAQSHASALFKGKIEDDSFLAAIGPIVDRARLRLGEKVQALAASRSNLSLYDQTVEDMLAESLQTQLSAIMDRTMVLELHVARLGGHLSGVTARERFCSFIEHVKQPEIALSILREYPVLARQLITRVEQWLAASAEFLERLCVDWEDIRAKFNLESSPGLLTKLSSGLGDRHRDGRSVMIAEFASGFRLVYKPRELSLDYHFQNLLDWLNRRGANPPFRLLNILNRGAYGWAEFVPLETCASPEEVARFYERMGGYLALLYVLEATDFHCENLIASGDQPVLVDLEALFHPRVNGIDIRDAETLACESVNYSVLATGLLPHAGGTGMADFSGLGSADGELSPIPVPVWENAGTDQMRLVRRRIAMNGSHNQPTLRSEKVSVLDYAKAITAGFNSIYRLILHHREAFLAENGPLEPFAEDEIRVIARSTREYAFILRESYHPDFLRDGLDRDRVFDRLGAAAAWRPHLTQLMAAEREDLHRGDIPIFTSRPSSRELRTSQKQKIGDFFDETGMSLVRRRVGQLSERDLAQQLWIVRCSLATLATGEERPQAASYSLTPSEVIFDRRQLMDLAELIGKRIEDLSLKGEHDVSWVGLTLNEKEQWALAPLGMDLYSGLPGVILFLAYLGQASGDSRYTDLSKTALATLRRQIDRRRTAIQTVGAFSGWGGMIYLFTHLAILWKREDLFDEAKDLIDSLDPLIAKDEQMDIVGGAAGCLVALLGFNHCNGDERALDLAIQCGDRLVNHAHSAGDAMVWLNPAFADKPLTGFSHGIAGIAWALLKLSAATGTEQFRAVALQALKYEHRVFSEEAGNWPDFRALAERARTSGDAPGFCTAWCHGATGIGLARLSSLEYVSDRRLRADVDVALKTTMAKGFGDNHCLCHGDLGNIELLLQASLVLGGPERMMELTRTTSMVAQSVATHGAVCGTALRVDSPGLMTGLAGIGYGLLRLAEPHRIPSVLLLAPPCLI